MVSLSVGEVVLSAEDAAAVFELAVVTDCRSAGEQMALVTLAREIDSASGDAAVDEIGPRWRRALESWDPGEKLGWPHGTYRMEDGRVPVPLRSGAEIGEAIREVGRHRVVCGDAEIGEAIREAEEVATRFKAAHPGPLGPGVGP